MQTQLDYTRLLNEARRVRRAPGMQTLRIALLGDCALAQFVPVLRALFARADVWAEFHEGAFDGVELEALNPDSTLYHFEPDVIVLLNAVQSLRDKYYQRSGDGGALADETIARMTRVWDSLRQHSAALIVQSNFAAPIERFYGNYDLKVDSSLPAVAARLNTLITEEARKQGQVLVNDVERLASWLGRREWFDERFWTLAKSFCAPELLPAVAKNIVDIVLSTRGRVVKCVIVDLDNTLWGGIVGDDGPHGIRIAAHGEGEEFFRLQCFLRELKNRGILLAVCSKNERATAVAPFEENSGMALKLSDIAVFVANWDNKASNIAKIRDTLNIGLDSMVFLDDNPFERNLVREMLPGVIVPELPEDPSEYVRAISELNLFETNTHTAEDRQRTDFYRAEAQRQNAVATAATFEEFLQSLGMRIDVRRFVPEQLARIEQLFQRSNQFNLTTHRYTRTQCEAMMNDGTCLPLFASLSDRFGDHGLISIVVARAAVGGDSLLITDWLMSCRVLSRGVEEYLMNRIVDEAHRRALKCVRGEFVPTSKNAMVKEFFARFGFERSREDPDGRAGWVLQTEVYIKRPVFIQPAEDKVPVAV